MKKAKKFLVGLIALVSISVFALGLTGCEMNSVMCNHIYNQEIVSEKYLKSVATCQNKAVYYKSCNSCGKAGLETFEYGDLLKHTPVKGVCSMCEKEVGSTGLSYQPEVTGKYYIVSIGSCKDSDIYIPEFYYNVPVAEIAGEGFANSDITSITIPKSVTEIGSNAFDSCDNLTNVYYMGDIADWCNITFANYYFNHSPHDNQSENSANPLVNGANLYINNEKISELVLPDSVTYISDFAFQGASFTSVTLDSVRYIGRYAFSGCTALTNLIIPDSLTTIHDGVFYGCGNLTSVTIGNSVETIGDYAFYNCDSLTNLTIGDSVETIGDGVFYNCTGLTSIEMPDTVEYIGDYAFRNCDSLESVTIPDLVTAVGDYAFYWCDSLESITIPDLVTAVGDYAFAGCDSLTSVTIGNSVTTIGARAFYGCDSLTSVTIGNSVTTIGDEAFSGCTSLTSITIPDSVTTIGNYAFEDCTSLTSATIPDSVTTIGDRAFAYCSSLTSVTIGNSVTTIGNWAFYSCDNLTSVTIGGSVTTIGYEAFASCYNLTSVVFIDTSTWYRTRNYEDWQNKVKGEQVDVSDAEDAADLLKASYYDNYYWYKL